MKNFILFSIVSLLSHTVTASTSAHINELDPYSDDIQEKIQELDEVYAEQNAAVEIVEALMNTTAAGCYQFSCNVFIDIQKSTQRATLYVDGKFYSEFKVSTGTAGHGTPNFDRHPDGRIYDKYSSSKYPGGDYNGLGNMPYVVFISGGFGIHGTPKGNWPKLGTAASHGCVRVHPDNGFIFNRLVRQHGVKNTWITVRN